VSEGKAGRGNIDIYSHRITGMVVNHINPKDWEFSEFGTLVARLRWEPR
jgi:hypothetical protein